MKNNKNTQRIIIILVAVLLIYMMWKRNQAARSGVPAEEDPGVGDIPGCTNPMATNYNAAATVENGSCHYMTQSCCDNTASNYDGGCSGDPNCQCSQQVCNMLTGRTACCDTLATEYDPTCQGDPDCSCDASLCLTTIQIGNRTSCCTVGSVNYDSTCNSDPYCTCDNSTCQQQQSAHTCYTNCIGSGFQSVLTTLACGSGAVSNYPQTLPPVCGGSQA